MPITRLVERYPKLSACAESIQTAFEALLKTIHSGRKILICGNGGSAADTEHIVGELLKGFRNPRVLETETVAKFKKVFPAEAETITKNLQHSIPAIALTGHPSLLTAFANDVNPHYAFAQQVFGLGQSGDILWAISTSGKSENVVNAIKVATVQKLTTLGMTGQNPSPVSDLCDITIQVPETDTSLVQEFHLPVYHCLCEMLETELFGKS